jgi:hypothetical protein
MGQRSDKGLIAQSQLHPCIPARIAIPSPFSNFQRLLLQCERFRVIHVVTAVITAKGACTMTTSTTENREPAQATATAAGKPEPPRNAKVAAPKPRVAPAKAKSAKKTASAKKAVKAARQATPAKADRVRQGSKTARVLELVKRSGGVTLKHLVKATGWQPHSVRGFLSGNLGKKMGLKIESSKTNDGERVYKLAK